MRKRFALSLHSKSTSTEKKFRKSKIQNFVTTNYNMDSLQEAYQTKNRFNEFLLIQKDISLFKYNLKLILTLKNS